MPLAPQLPLPFLWSRAWKERLYSRACTRWISSAGRVTHTCALSARIWMHAPSPKLSRGCSPAHWPSAGNQGAQLEQSGNGEAPPGRLWGGLASISLFSLSTPADCEVALASVSLLSLSTPATGPVAKQQVKRASRAISEQT